MHDYRDMLELVEDKREITSSTESSVQKGGEGARLLVVGCRLYGVMDGK